MLSKKESSYHQNNYVATFCLEFYDENESTSDVVENKLQALIKHINTKPGQNGLFKEDFLAFHSPDAFAYVVLLEVVPNVGLGYCRKFFTSDQARGRKLFNNAHFEIQFTYNGSLAV